MLKFFKSVPPATEGKVRNGTDTPRRTATQASPRPAPSTVGMPPAPPPLPEVSEGNLESDWALWEDSVAFQDSQMPSGFNELDAVRTRETAPKKKTNEPDPFSTVRRRGS